MPRFGHCIPSKNSDKPILRADKPYMKHLEALHDKELITLTNKDLTDLKDRLAQTIGQRTGKFLSPQTQKHVLALLRRLLRFASEKELCPIPNLNFKMPIVDNTKTEFMTDEQLARYIHALNTDKDQTGANILRFALLTGIRKSAILALQWCDVDMKRGFVTLQGTSAKSGKTNILPLSEEALQVLQNVKRTDSPYIFPSPRTGGKRQDIRKLADRIKRRAGLPQDFRSVHGLRHHFASTLASTGIVDLYTLQKLLTHGSADMTARYAHLRDETLRKALESAPKTLVMVKQ